MSIALVTPRPARRLERRARGMLAYEDLRAALDSVQIAHHVSGRIRLKLVPDITVVAARAPLLRHVDAVINRIAGVRSLRANVLARSCIVEYDPDVIPDEAWPDFLAGKPSDAATILERILRDTYREIANAEL